MSFPPVGQGLHEMDHFYYQRMLVAPTKRNPSASHKPVLPPVEVNVTKEVTETYEVRTPDNETPVAWSFVTVAVAKPAKSGKKFTKFARKGTDTLAAVAQEAGGVADTSGIFDEGARAGEEIPTVKKSAVAEKDIATRDTAIGNIAAGGVAEHGIVAGEVGGVTEDVGVARGSVFSPGVFSGAWRMVAQGRFDENGRIITEEGVIGVGRVADEGGAIDEAVLAGDWRLVAEGRFDENGRVIDEGWVIRQGGAVDQGGAVAEGGVGTERVTSTIEDTGSKVTEVAEEVVKGPSCTASQRKRFSSSSYEPKKRLSAAYGIVRDNERDERVVPEGW